MPRSIMTPDGLIFIEDLNLNNDVMLNTNLINNSNLYIPNVGYVGPRTAIRTQPSYSDVNNDPELRKRVVKYFHGKVEVWLYGAYKDLGDYLVEKNGNVELGTSKGETNMTPNKARYLMDKIIRRSVILSILDKYVRRKNVNWYDLKEKHMSDLKEYIHAKLKSHIRRISI